MIKNFHHGQHVIQVQFSGGHNHAQILYSCNICLHSILNNIFVIKQLIQMGSQHFKFKHKFINSYYRQMNTKIKIKYKNAGDGHQRTNTDYTQTKKSTVLTNKTLTMVNKKIINLSNVQPKKNTSHGPQNKASSKSTLMMSKMATQTYDKNKMPMSHKLGADKIFNKLRTKDTNKESTTKKNKSNSSLKLNKKPQTQDRYEVIEQVGSGTFGTVFKARDKKSLDVMAIKKVFQDKKYKNRQLQILKMLRHPHVLEIKDSFFTYQKQKQYLNVVMEYYPLNLQQFISHQHLYAKVSYLQVKVFAYQMFRGLLYLQHIGIAHRDIKPHNVLIRPENWKLSICDFGSAKKLVQGQPNISYICSRCYRAPQLIFGSTTYTPQIDVWSAGCVFIEMITGSPIFKANSNIDQLVEIVKVMGTPNKTQIKDMNPDCDFQKYGLPKILKKPWKRMLKAFNLEDKFFDLIDNIMKYSPMERYSPLSILTHPYFDELRQQSVYKELREKQNIPDLFNFAETKELPFNQVQNLIPKWYQ